MMSSSKFLFCGVYKLIEFHVYNRQVHPHKKNFTFIQQITNKKHIEYSLKPASNVEKTTSAKVFLSIAVG